MPRSASKPCAVHLGLFLATVTLACSETKTALPSDAPAQPAFLTDAAPSDGGASGLITDAAAEYTGPWLYALFLQTPIMSEMAFPTREQEQRRRDGKNDKDKGPLRIGYLRQGSRVPVIAQAHKTDKCP